jgi:hypothetical protein
MPLSLRVVLLGACSDYLFLDLCLLSDSWSESASASVSSDSSYAAWLSVVSNNSIKLFSCLFLSPISPFSLKIPSLYKLNIDGA